MTFVVSAERVFTPEARGPGRVAVEDGVVVEVTGPGRADAAVPVLTPGFVDLQCNGTGDVSFATGGEANWERARALLAPSGATAVLPTLITGTPVTQALEGFCVGGPGGAGVPEFPGVHLEGPMLSPARHGAHPVEGLGDVDVAAVLEWPVRLVTLAPELPGALNIVRRLVAGGVTVAAGHSDADAGEAAAAFDAGVRLVTHLWNAMRPMTRRDPGLAGTALVDDRVRVCVICDGVHVDPIVVEATWRAVGPRRFVAVTDSVGVTAAGGSRAGLHVDGAVVRDRGGDLTGSAITMDVALRNLVRWGLGTADAVAAVTSNPAAAIGLSGRGCIEVGSRADLVALDADLHVLPWRGQTPNAGGL